MKLPISYIRIMNILTFTGSRRKGCIIKSNPNREDFLSHINGATLMKRIHMELSKRSTILQFLVLLFNISLHLLIDEWAKNYL